MVRSSFALPCFTTLDLHSLLTSSEKLRSVWPWGRWEFRGRCVEGENQFEAEIVAVTDDDAEGVLLRAPTKDEGMVRENVALQLILSYVFEVSTFAINTINAIVPYIHTAIFLPRFWLRSCCPLTIFN